MFMPIVVPIDVPVLSAQVLMAQSICPNKQACPLKIKNKWFIIKDKKYKRIIFK